MCDSNSGLSAALFYELIHESPFTGIAVLLVLEPLQDAADRAVVLLTGSEERERAAIPEDELRDEALP